MQLFGKLKVFVVFVTLLCASPTSSMPEMSCKKVAIGATVAATAVGLTWFISSLQGNSPEDLMHFGQEILKNPAQMGAGFPCSKYLAKASIAQIPACSNGKNRKFLEVGAGTGVVTSKFVKKLQPGDTLDVVELQEPLCEILSKKFSHIEGVKVHCTPIEEFNPGKKYDTIIMTVPFNALPFALVKTIWTHVISLLADGGTLSYIYDPGLQTLKKMALSGAEKEDFQNIQTYLSDLHKQFGTGHQYTVRNLPIVCTRYFKFDQKPQEITQAPEAA